MNKSEFLKLPMEERRAILEARCTPEIVRYYEVTCPDCGRYYAGHATGGQDICTCHGGAKRLTADEIEALKEIARIVAYPKRGTDEEQVSIFDVADLIQRRFKLEDLQSVRGIVVTSLRDRAALRYYEPVRNREGELCGLCDGTHEHSHPQLQCAKCSTVGLARNMEGHVC